jgi:hypothetical protein
LVAVGTQGAVATAVGVIAAVLVLLAVVRAGRQSALAGKLLIILATTLAVASLSVALIKVVAGDGFGSRTEVTVDGERA